MNDTGNKDINAKVRLDANMYRALEARANEERSSIARIIRMAVEQYLKAGK